MKLIWNLNSRRENKDWRRSLQTDRNDTLKSTISNPHSTMCDPATAWFEQALSRREYFEQETVIELNCDLDTLFSTKSGIDTGTGHVDIITNLKIRRPSIIVTMTPWAGRKIVTQQRYGSAVTLLTDWIQTRKVTLTLKEWATTLEVEALELRKRK